MNTDSLKATLVKALGPALKKAVVLCCALYLLFCVYLLVTSLVAHQNNHFAETGYKYLPSSYVISAILIFVALFFFLVRYRKRGWSVIACIGFLSIAAGIFIPCSTGVSITNSPQYDEMSDLRRVGVAMEQYAIDHDGRFPGRLSELIGDYLSPGFHLDKFYDYATQQAQDWIYFPGHKAGGDPKSVLAACPVPLEQKGRRVRFVLYGNLTTGIVPEAEFREILKKQISDTSAHGVTVQEVDRQLGGGQKSDNLAP